MNAHSWLKTAQTKIERLDAELILAHILNANRSHLHSYPEIILTKTQQNTANKLLVRRQNHEPIAYLFNKKDFYGRTFKITKDTLIPRPETETLIDLAKTLNPKTILDLGTGSGCIAITLSLELPNSKITASDISQKALKIAQHNAKSLKADNVIFKKSDLLENISGQFDLICANLPYVNPDWTWNSPDLEYEPSQALYASEDGLFLIKKFLQQAQNILKPTGHILIESDQSQQSQIISFSKSLGFKHVETKDLIVLLQK